MALEMLGGLVAHQLECVAALDQCLPFGGEALQFDRFHLRAVLFPLATALPLLVVVELALDPVGGAMEEVDGRPEKVVEVGLEAGVAEGRDQGIEYICDGPGDDVSLRERSRIGFVLEWAVAVELEFGENVDRDPRGLLATKAVGRAGPAPGASAQGQASRRMAKAGYFVSRWKALLLERAGK